MKEDDPNEEVNVSISSVVRVYAIAFLGLVGLLLVAALVYVAFHGLAYVSFSKAERVGDNYFQALETGDTSSVMRLYSSEFTDEAYRLQWANFLDEKAKEWGPCQSHSLEREEFAPRVKENPKIPADHC